MTLTIQAAAAAGLKEETIVSNISSLDPSVFQDINSLASNASLGRWTVLAGETFHPVDFPCVASSCNVQCTMYNVQCTVPCHAMLHCVISQPCHTVAVLAYGRGLGGPKPSQPLQPLLRSFNTSSLMQPLTSLAFPAVQPYTGLRLCVVHSRAFATVDEKPYQPYNGPNSSGKFTKLFSFGARSFAIWRLDQVSDDKVRLAASTACVTQTSG